ncbi:hypothetical protein [Arthrobacter sp. Bi26]|uniref:hypothetical protein n=1 Tax=Arthrobacter sp. Bi26 TaxID=2822350 RepID=UPI001E4860E3|nr:hypothetical protein [Arthrobacter sp. Bi26]
MIESKVKMKGRVRAPGHGPPSGGPIYLKVNSIYSKIVIQSIRLYQVAARIAIGADVMASITRFHISWLLTSALREVVIDGLGKPSLSSLTSYTTAFMAAPTTGAEWLKPWGSYETGHKYWAALLGSGYSTAQAYSGWIKQVPLLRSRGFVPTTNRLNVIVTCERYLYPSGVGIAVTATFEGDLTLEAAASLQQQLTQLAVFKASDDKIRTIDMILLHEVQQLEKDVLGSPSSSPVRGLELTTVTTISGATGTTSTEEATALLRQMCYPGQPPGNTLIIANKHGKFAETIRLAGQNTQASWSPKRSTTPKESDGLTCYHHNTVLSALHIAQLLNLAELAGPQPAKEPAHAQQLYTRAGAVLGWAYGGESVYSTYFAPAAIDDSHLVNGINLIRKDLAGHGPIHLRNAPTGPQTTGEPS